MGLNGQSSLEFVSTSLEHHRRTLRDAVPFYKTVNKFQELVLLHIDHTATFMKAVGDFSTTSPCPRLHAVGGCVPSSAAAPPPAAPATSHPQRQADAKAASQAVRVGTQPDISAPLRRWLQAYNSAKERVVLLESLRQPYDDARRKLHAAGSPAACRTLAASLDQLTLQYGGGVKRFQLLEGQLAKHVAWLIHSIPHLKEYFALLLTKLASPWHVPCEAPNTLLSFPRDVLSPMPSDLFAGEQYAHHFVYAEQDPTMPPIIPGRVPATAAVSTGAVPLSAAKGTSSAAPGNKLDGGNAAAGAGAAAAAAGVVCVASSAKGSAAVGVAAAADVKLNGGAAAAGRTRRTSSTDSDVEDDDGGGGGGGDSLGSAAGVEIEMLWDAESGQLRRQPATDLLCSSLEDSPADGASVPLPSSASQLDEAGFEKVLQALFPPPRPADEAALEAAAGGSAGADADAAVIPFSAANPFSGAAPFRTSDSGASTAFAAAAINPFSSAPSVSSAASARFTDANPFSIKGMFIAEMCSAPSANPLGPADPFSEFNPFSAPSAAFSAASSCGSSVNPFSGASAVSTNGPPMLSARRSNISTSNPFLAGNGGARGGITI